MTCVIAHRDGWMVADRRVTFDGGLIGPYVVNKIQRGPGLLVATAGCASLGERIKRALNGATPEDALERLQNLFLHSDSSTGQPGHALVLHGYRIYEITSRGSLSELDNAAAYWSIGSGFQVALGFLKGLETATAAAKVADRILTPVCAMKAIEYASTLVNDVGDGVQVERL